MSSPKTCPVCEEPDDDGSIAYGCEICGRMVCGNCVQEGDDFEPPICLDCEKPETEPPSVQEDNHAS